MLAAPTSAALRVGVVVSAACGLLVRYATLALWPTPGQAVVTTMILVLLTCLALGVISTTGRPRALRPVIAGFIGSLASVSILAAVAIGSSPALCAVYVVVTPLGATAGLGLGLLIGVHHRHRNHAIVDHA